MEKIKAKKKKRTISLSDTLEIASGYSAIKAHDKAIKTYLEFVKKSEVTNENDQKDIVFALKEVARIYISEEKYTEAVEHMRQAA